MEIDTLIILGMLAASLGWWFSIHVKEERLALRKGMQAEKDKRARAERVKRLTNKL